MERRNITLEKKHLNILSPLLEKNDGNISASIREIIDFADMMIKSHGSLENAMDDAVSSERIEIQRVLVDQMIWQWMLEMNRGILPEIEIVKSLFGPVPEFKFEDFVKSINNLCIRLGWKTRTEFKELMTYQLTGGSENQRELILKIISLYLVDEKIGIEYLSNRYSITTIRFINRNNKTEAYDDCIRYLGYMDRSIKEIRSKPDFWNLLIGSHINTQYHMVTIPRKNYENLISNNINANTDLFSIFTGQPCKEINLQRLLPLIKSVFETSRIIDRIEIEQDILKVYHSYTIRASIEAVTNTILNILEKNGYHYEAADASGIIVLIHKTEIDGRITELVDNLLSARAGFDYELMTFLIFLDGIKEKSDINFAVEKLGKRMGEQILKEYESEFNIEEWDMEKFKDAFSNIDKKLGRESNLELIDPNVMHYIVDKCQIVHPHGQFNKHLCNLTHWLLKGAVEYVFKGDAIIKSKKLIGSGDDFCEFYVVFTSRVRMPISKSYEL
jgi:predicted hydrocarbon binding protein